MTAPFRKLCIEKMWKEPSAPNLCNPGCPTCDFYEKLIVTWEQKTLLGARSHRVLRDYEFGQFTSHPWAQVDHEPQTKHEPTSSQAQL